MWRSFLLSRSLARSHETALRVALGAARARLVRELLSDSVVISIAGGAVGILLAFWTSRLLPALLYEQDAESLVFAPDLLAVASAAAVCLAITIVCGLLPVIVTSHDRPSAVLRREGAGASPALRRLRLGLVVAQMAVCCVLVVSTAFLIGGLRAALVKGAGQRFQGTVLAGLQSRPDTGIAYFRAADTAIRSVAGVGRVVWAARPPGSQPVWQSFRVETPHSAVREIPLDVLPFTADKLPELRLPPLSGRMFGLADQSCRSAVANREAAEDLFGPAASGRVIHDSAGRTVEIIGVVAHRNPGRNRPALYYDFTNSRGPLPAPQLRAPFRAPPMMDLPLAELDTNVVSPGYFEWLGMQLIAGQNLFDPAGRYCRIGVVNREAADLYFGGRAVGAALIDARGSRITVVGVVQSAQAGTFERRVEPAVYLPMVQDVLPRMSMVIQVAKSSDSTLAALREVLDRVPGRGPAPVVVETLEHRLMQTSLAPLRIATVIIGAATTMALVLGVLGLIGSLSDAARQRRREIALRVALGAQRWRVVWQILEEGGRIAGAGAVVGTIGSVLMSRWLMSLSPGGGSPPWWVWLAAPVALAAAVAVASFLPVRRALLVNPLLALRD
jgi:cell division protein FtsX